MTTVVTTFSKDGYDLYGKRMVSSWIKFWPKDFKLIVYTENFNIQEKDIRIQEIDLIATSENLVKFKNKSFSLITDGTSKREKRKIQKTVKWCHKVYAIKHALETINDDYLIFLDGDTYSKASVPENFAYTLVKEKLFAVHFENLPIGLHFETGLIVFNMRHPKIKWLSNILTSCYDDMSIYDMKKTWDGFWFAYLYENYRLPVINLNPKPNGVFQNENVQPYLVHEVGPEKYRLANYDEFTGKSKK